MSPTASSVQGQRVADSPELSHPKRSATEHNPVELQNMAARQLSPELVSLIHHVELNESGWWRKAVGQMVRAVLWKRGTPATFAELAQALKDDAGVPMAEEVLERQLESLQSQGAVLRMPGPNYKLTVKAADELSAAHEKATGEQTRCRTHFLASCATHTPTLASEKIWGEFTKALQSAVRVTGANLFHLIADGNLERDVDWLTEFLGKFGAENREGLRLVLKDFFARDNRDCRNQVLRLLNAHFFAEAAQLRPETLQLIEGSNKKRTIKVVLDTNFVFSALKLDGNPGNDSALSLLELAKRSSKHLEIKLYVLPETLDEAKTSLMEHLRKSQRIRTTAAINSAALTQPLPSVVRQFFNAASKSPGLTADVYFKPYIEDLRTILRDKGIFVLEAHSTVYRSSQAVIDDVLDEQKRENQELPETKRKGYERLMHDMVLWHAVNDRRDATTDSPFDVEYWAVSMDWRLIHFDRQKRNSKATRLPVVLHASNLVQLVLFWVPRSAELDDTLVDSLRLPLLFESFSPEDEEATVKVLTTISRFENLEDFPESTVHNLLANQALRGRLMSVDATNERAFELVRDELLTIHHDAVYTLDKSQIELARTAEELAEERRQRSATDDKLQQAGEQSSAAEERAKEAERQMREALQRAQDAETSLVTREQTLSAQVKASEENAAKARTALTRLKYTTGVLAAPAIGGPAVGVWAYSQLPTLFSGLAAMSMPSIVALSAAVALAPLAGTAALSPWLTNRYPALQNWRVSSVVNFVGRKFVLAPLALGASTITQNGFWETVKSSIGF